MSSYLKSNIRLEKIRIRNKKSNFKNLTNEQKKLVKKWLEYQKAEKTLYSPKGFLFNPKRLVNNQIDYSEFNEVEMQTITNAFKIISNFNHTDEVEQAVKLYNQYNTHSVSF